VLHFKAKVKFTNKNKMRNKAFIFIAIAIVFMALGSNATRIGSQKAGGFKIEKDLLLVQFDCKTDVDDLHTAAALITLMSHPGFANIHYHAVAGTYGIQEGLYVPPNDLLQLAFGDNWTDAHEKSDEAVKKLKQLAETVLSKKGDIWIAEAGQSDFSAKLIKSIQTDMPELDLANRIHVVQHSNWNEEVTSATALQFVRQNVDYQKIPDGNTVGNGTPGFRTPGYTEWKKKLSDKRLLQIWQLAVEIGNTYNGKDGRYNNEAVSSGGLDFSDLAEVCWILGIQDIKDTEEFFNRYAQ
jgi:hypothetical protein